MGNANKNAEVCSNIIDNDMEELDNDIYSGFGIKKMKAYKCNLNSKELNKKREYFWKVKTNPRNKNWTTWITIHQAIKYDEERASLLLELYHISLINGCINHLIDEYGNKYKIPNYCINDPYFKRDMSTDNSESQIIKIKFYSYGNKHSIILEVNTQWTAKKLKEEFIKNQKIDGDKKIRFFVCGIEIKDDEFLYQHKVNQGKPIYVIIN